MTSQEAETIVNEFVDTIKETEQYALARPNSFLPFSKGKIIKALLIHAANLFQNHLINEQIHSALTITCSTLGTFFDDKYALEIEKLHDNKYKEDRSIDREKAAKLEEFWAKRLAKEDLLREVMVDYLYELFNKKSPYEKV